MLTPLRRPLVLASASPRRADLLTQIGLSFRVLPSHIDEPPPGIDEDVAAWAQRAAADKARATAALLPPQDALVLGADTIVVVPTEMRDLPSLHNHPVQVFGKPRDIAEARRMLQVLSGRTHTVISAFALLDHPAGSLHIEAVETDVRFRELSPADIETYLTSGEPMDKAGAYGIQGLGAVLIDGIRGDYYTVVGLPLAPVWCALAPWRVENPRPFH